MTNPRQEIYNQLMSKEIVPTTISSQVRQSPEFSRYMDKLFERLPDLAVIAATIPEGSKRSVEDLKAIGEFWRDKRSEKSLTVRELAERLRIDWSDLLLFECGFIDKDKLSGKFFVYLGLALGDPTLVYEFKGKFGTYSKNHGILSIFRKD